MDSRCFELFKTVKFNRLFSVFCYQMILITGGCGFIGSNFIRYLLNLYDDIKILNLDKLTYAGNLDNLKTVETDKRYSFIKGDIADSEILDSIFKSDIELVINFAAESHVDRSIAAGDSFIHTNIVGTHLLLEYCRKFDCKFIQISTDEVYGSREDGYFKETDVLNPSSIYSASKASAEMLTNSYKVTYGLEVNITRSSNNFGPFQYPEKLIPRFITNLFRNKKLPIYGSGNNIRDWIYVEDNCRALDLIIQKGKSGNTYNIGGGNERSNLEIAQLILSKLNYGEEMIEFVSDRLGHDFRYAIDTTKLKKLNWNSKYSFEEGLDKTIEWYKNNNSWWERLIKI